MPLFLFIILFGLSMDYHVFVLSRIREGSDRGLSTRQAVARRDRPHGQGHHRCGADDGGGLRGLRDAGRMLDLKQLGLGLAAAVLLDATIIRAVLLPAVDGAAPKENLYLPRWLQWLPHLEHTARPTAELPHPPAPTTTPDVPVVTVTS